MNRILLLIFVAWLLLGNGATNIKTWLSTPQVAQVGATIATGASVALTPQATARIVSASSAGGTVSVRVVNPPVVVATSVPILVTQTPSPLPTDTPPIPLDKGEYVFVDRGINVVNRYCIQVPALGREICDPDVSMTWDETQRFVARSLKLGTMAGTPIEED